MMEKIPYSVGNYILPLKCNFGISYGIGQKYLPIWVSVSDLNQNSGFGRTLTELLRDALLKKVVNIFYIVM